MRLTGTDHYWLNQLRSPLSGHDRARLVLMQRHLTSVVERRLVESAIQQHNATVALEQPAALSAERLARQAELKEFGARRLAAATAEALRARAPVHAPSRQLPNGIVRQRTASPGRR